MHPCTGRSAASPIPVWPCATAGRAKGPMPTSPRQAGARTRTNGQGCAVAAAPARFGASSSPDLTAAARPKRAHVRDRREIPDSHQLRCTEPRRLRQESALLRNSRRSPSPGRAPGSTQIHACCDTSVLCSPPKPTALRRPCGTPLLCPLRAPIRPPRNRVDPAPAGKPRSPTRVTYLIFLFCRCVSTVVNC